MKKIPREDVKKIQAAIFSMTSRNLQQNTYSVITTCREYFCNHTMLLKHLEYDTLINSLTFILWNYCLP